MAGPKLPSGAILAIDFLFPLYFLSPYTFLVVVVVVVAVAVVYSTLLLFLSTMTSTATAVMNETRRFVPNPIAAGLVS